jgi:hypothetical protein
MNCLPGNRRSSGSVKQRALAQQKVTMHQSVLAGAASFVQQHLDHLRLKQVFLALLVVLCLASYTYWYNDQSIAELELIDSALLSDDLPIAAFTDQGFDAWLKSSASAIMLSSYGGAYRLGRGAESLCPGYPGTAPVDGTDGQAAGDPRAAE